MSESMQNGNGGGGFPWGQIVVEVSHALLTVVTTILLPWLAKKIAGPPPVEAAPEMVKNPPT